MEKTEISTIERAAKTADCWAQPGPEELSVDAHFLEPESSFDLSVVRWPSLDKNAPDYAYLSHRSSSSEFSLSADRIDRLIKLNRYQPNADQKVIAFALRGAALKDGFDVENTEKVSLQNLRPDHRNLRCVIGFYFTETKKISLYSGSTVPCRRAVWGYANGGSHANMLPTGLHTFYVWRHKALQPALRMGLSAIDPESGAKATVLRTTNDTIFGTRDKFDLSIPYDNVHCTYFLDEQAYYGASFSSWGCLTVRGKQSPTHQWEKFQAVLLRLGAKSKVDLILATGEDLAVMESLDHNPIELETVMGVLRKGSSGEEVKALQARIGLTGPDVDGDFGPNTLEKFTSFQRRFNADHGQGHVADGIYTRALDRDTGWNIFSKISDN